MANFVLVHGAGHGGWCWQRLARLLRAEGHEVYAPTLTGLGERAHLLRPGTDLALHIADIASVLKYEDLTDVILVGHSYAGAVITGAADRAAARIRHLVFLDAAEPKNGQSIVDTAPALMHLVGETPRVVNGVELVQWPSAEGVGLLGVTDPKEAAWVLERLTPHPLVCYTQPLRLENEAAVLKIPRTTIFTPLLSKVLSPEAVRRIRESERAWAIDSGHDLMLTAPETVAQMLFRVASL